MKKLFVTKVDGYIPILFGLEHNKNELKMLEVEDAVYSYNNRYENVSNKFLFETVFSDNLSRITYRASNSYLLGKGLGFRTAFDYQLYFIICYNPNGSILKEDYVILCSGYMQQSDITKLKKQMNLNGLSSRKNFKLVQHDYLQKFLSSLPLTMDDYLPESVKLVSDEFLASAKSKLQVTPDWKEEFKEEIEVLESKGMEIIDEEIEEASIDEHIDNILEEVEDEPDYPF